MVFYAQLVSSCCAYRYDDEFLAKTILNRGHFMDIGEIVLYQPDNIVTVEFG